MSHRADRQDLEYTAMKNWGKRNQMADDIEIAIESAVLRALSPRSASERFRLFFARGYSVLQVFERLDSEGRAAILSQFGASFTTEAEPEVVLRRRAVETLRARLLGLVASGRVRRRTGRYAAELNSKGQRDVVVDLFRLG